MTQHFALEWREREGLAWLAWECAGVAAAFPTRGGGVSPAPFDSLNLGLSVADAPAHVLENRRRWCDALGVPQGRLVVPGQVHGSRLAWVGEAEAGRGAFGSADVLAAHDGLLTAAPGLGLCISYADCVPVVIAARGADGPALATVHAGWRGMLAGIVGRRPRAWRSAAACSAPWSARASAPAASPWTTPCGRASRSAFPAPACPAASTSGPAPPATCAAAGVPPGASPSRSSAPRRTSASSRTAATTGRPAGIWRSPGGRKRDEAPEVGR